MRTFIGMAVLAVLLIGPAMVLAQQPVSRTEEVSAAFTIEAIDHSTRVVTLRNKAGLLEEVYCGPEVQRFDALKVGDTVTFRYYETVVTALSKPGAAAPPSTTVTRTPGAPGGSHRPRDHRHRHLETIDPKTPAVTVRTAAGGRSMFKVQDAKNLEGYKAGDQVTITYTRGLAISVTPPAAAEPKPSMDIYGFAMLDIGHDFKQVDPDWFDTLRATKLPSYENQFGEDNRNFAGVRQSRLGVRTSSPTAMGELKTHVRVRAHGHRRRHRADDLPVAPRLRRARRVRGGPVPGARSWTSTSSPTRSSTWGPTGMVLFRNVHVRWMPVKGDEQQLTFALERPGASNDTGRLTNRVELEDVTARFPMPDFSGHYRMMGDWGHAQVAGIVRKFNWDDNNDDQFDLSGSEVGLGHQPHLGTEGHRRRHPEAGAGLRRRHPELHERLAGGRRHRPSTRQRAHAGDRRGHSAARHHGVRRSRVEQPLEQLASATRCRTTTIAKGRTPMPSAAATMPSATCCSRRCPT